MGCGARAAACGTEASASLAAAGRRRAARVSPGAAAAAAAGRRRSTAGGAPSLLSDPEDLSAFLPDALRRRTPEAGGSRPRISNRRRRSAW